MCAELGGELMRRRLMMDMGMEEDESMSWKVLLDKTVEDNSITYYSADAQGCKEFYVSIFFANDEEITNQINGCIGINTKGSPWGAELRVCGNIPNIAYAQAGDNNKAIVFGFEIANGIIIPVRLFASYNNAASSAYLSTTNAAQLLINKSIDKNELSYKTVDEVQNISVGSYAKYFGVGSKILILGR